MEVAVSSNFPNKLKLVFVCVGFTDCFSVMGEVQKLSLCVEEFHIIEVGGLG